MAPSWRGRLLIAKKKVNIQQSQKLDTVFPELVISYEVRNFGLDLVTKFLGP